jgi:predicted transcriptional regulator
MAVMTNMDREGTPAEQLMTSDITTVSPDVAAEQAVTILLEEDIGSLVVTDDDGHLAGIITSNDFLETVSELDAAGATVAELMSDEVLTISPDDSIQTAAARMITNGISHLPVEDDTGVVGMISTTDITAYSVSM